MMRCDADGIGMLSKVESHSIDLVHFSDALPAVAIFATNVNANTFQNEINFE